LDITIDSRSKIGGIKPSFLMKRLLLAPLILLLLTSCQSKKDICASWAVGVISYREAQEKLDVQSPGGYCQDYKD